MSGKYLIVAEDKKSNKRTVGKPSFTSIQKARKIARNLNKMDKTTHYGVLWAETK